MNAITKQVNTTETQKREIYTPNFIRLGVGGFLIKDVNSGEGRVFDCKKESDILAALKLFVYYTTKGVRIDTGLTQNRLAEYIAKRLYPNVTPYLFDTCYCHYLKIDDVTVKENGNKTVYSTSAKCVDSVNLLKTVKITPQGMISYNPFKPEKGDLTNDIAEIVVEFFTDKYTIGWALQKCKQLGDYKLEHINDYIALQKTQNHIKQPEINQNEKQVIKNNDLFNTPDKTSDNKDDNLYSYLFGDVDKDNFIKLIERCHLIRNIVHLHTNNNAQFEKIVSDTENATNNYLLEKYKQIIKSRVDNGTPEMIKELLEVSYRYGKH